MKIVVALIMILFSYGIVDAKGTSLYVLQWSAIGTSTADAAPDELATLNGVSVGEKDYGIPIGMADEVTITCSTLNSDVTNASTDIDIDISCSVDGTNYDTTGTYYVEDFFQSLGDNVQDSDPLNTGCTYIKARLDNDDASNTAGAKCRFRIYNKR